MLVTLGCEPRAQETVVRGPEAPTDLTVTTVAEASEIFEGAGAVLSANVTGGRAPYLYRWDQNGGPEDVELTEVRGQELTVAGLTAPGRYVFRVIVTDARDNHETDFVVVNVRARVTVSGPALAVVGQPVELSATAASEGVSLLWEVIQGNGVLDDPNAERPMLTTENAETVEVRLTATVEGSVGPGATVVRTLEIASVQDLRPRVAIETNVGSFTIELDGEAAPLHTANLLLYTDDGFFDGLLFHRNVCVEAAGDGECEPFVLQGGGFERIDGELTRREPTRDPVSSESGNGLTNGEIYSVSLALTDGNANSGTTEFFINLDADNAFLDDQGFTVFGRVVEGTDVIDEIAAGERVDNPLIPGEVSLPVEDVIIVRATRVVQ